MRALSNWELSTTIDPSYDQDIRRLEQLPQ
jgi:hypothetical protein